MAANVSRNCHKMSQVAVTEQERQFAILIFVFLVLQKKAVKLVETSNQIIFDLGRILKKNKQFVTIEMRGQSFRDTLEGFTPKHMS